MTYSSLPADEVHVWSWRIGLGRASDKACGGLDETELRRAAGFVFARDRARYICAHVGLRRVLGALLGVGPEAVTIVADETGKPRLAGLFSARLHFNLSHSDDMVSLAVAADHPVGMDIERIRPINTGSIETFFAAGEQAALARLPPATRLTGLFNAWTRKEAYVKATGLGLSVPLDGFEVSLVPGQPVTLLRVEADPEEASHWQIAAFVPAAGYVGAVAVRARGWRIVPRALAALGTEYSTSGP